MNSELTSHALAEQCADLIVAGFPSYWNKPQINHWRQNLLQLILRKHPAVATYLADPETGIAAHSRYLLDQSELLKACRHATDAISRGEAQKQESQQASKFLKTVEA